jgi:hypothetical protein
MCCQLTNLGEHQKLYNRTLSFMVCGHLGLTESFILNAFASVLLQPDDFLHAKYDFDSPESMLAF